MRQDRPSSLARRVTWAVTGTAAVFLLVISLLAYETFARMEDSLVDEVLSSQIAALRDDLGAGLAVPATLPPRWSEGGGVSRPGCGRRIGRLPWKACSRRGRVAAKSWNRAGHGTPGSRLFPRDCSMSVTTPLRTKTGSGRSAGFWRAGLCWR